MGTGQRIKDQRLDRELTQRALAAKIGVDPITVSRWERDEVPPSDLNRVRLARFFGGHPNDYRPVEQEAAV